MNGLRKLPRSSLLRPSCTGRTRSPQRKTTMNDTYSKTTLSLVAACLLLVCFHLYFQPQSVRADQPEPPKEVKIVGFAPDLNLPVALTNSSVPVQIQGSTVLPVGIVGSKSSGTVPVFLRGANNAVVLRVTTTGQ